MHWVTSAGPSVCPSRCNPQGGRTLRSAPVLAPLRPVHWSRTSRTPRALAAGPGSRPGPGRSHLHLRRSALRYRCRPTLSALPPGSGQRSKPRWLESCPPPDRSGGYERARAHRDSEAECRAPLPRPPRGARGHREGPAASALVAEPAPGRTHRALRQLGPGRAAVHLRQGPAGTGAGTTFHDDPKEQPIPVGRILRRVLNERFQPNLTPPASVRASWCAPTSPTRAQAPQARDGSRRRRD